MLNPFAHDFKPTGLSTPPPEQKKDLHPIVNKKDPLPPPFITTKKSNDNHTQQKKKTSNVETKKPQQQKPKKTQQQTKAELSGSNKTKESQTHSNRSNKSAHSQQPHNRDRRKSSHHNTAATTSTTTLADQFTQETKFIAIETAIDPIHRIDKVEHGYERYIDWIDRSLRKFDTVTMVGMDNAIVDIVSMVTILHDRKIAAYDDIETFSMNQGNGRFTSCIQTKLHPYF